MAERSFYFVSYALESENLTHYNDIGDMLQKKGGKEILPRQWLITSTLSTKGEVRNRLAVMLPHFNWQTDKLFVTRLCQNECWSFNLGVEIPDIF